MFHTIQRNQTSRSSESCFAMYCDRALLLLNCFEKLINDVIWWWSAVQEVEIQVTNTGFHEFLFLILRLIQAYYKLDSKLLKYWYVVFGCKRAILVSDVKRSTKSNKFARKNPIQVAILYLFIKLVLLDIERRIVVPAESNRKLESLKTVMYGTLIRTRAHSCVSKWNKLRLIRFEQRPGVIS